MIHKLLGVVLVVGAMLISPKAKAQGNLQFNQVRKMQFTLVTPPNTNFTDSWNMLGPYVVNVPAGKVLKIESVNLSRTRSTNGADVFDATGGSRIPSLFLEETMIYSPPSYQSGIHGFHPSSIIWLPAGDHNFYISGWNCGGSFGSPCAISYTAMITSIEFNVVP